ncbi:MAG: ribonuclease P [Methanomicrobiaceae archaeon]|uniref:Ribonuclease p protein component 3 n=1 Tax=hydrocarbon metagenome TaxID=938273 RepID=A0A0W8FI02_9ZZZZ|nr:ribonuclease P [Methanomicrobiaceae archaeon]MDD5420375.1 RNase P subunit p30 family protein [Methanomicrobiaceae archaeon]
MNATDAGICPYPAGDSSLRRMAIEAADLGFDSVVAVDGERCALEGLVALRGSVISGQSMRDVLSGLRRVSCATDIVFVDAGNLTFNRSVIPLRGIHILRSIHTTPRNSFDHVSARMAADRGVAVDISLHPLLHSRGSARQRVIQRYADILTLHRRYRFLLTISSHARSILDQRSVRDAEALCALFGMTSEEVHAALKTVGTLLTPRQPVRVLE